MFEMIVVALISFCTLSIIWFTLKTGISPMPSSVKMCRAILEVSEQAADGCIIDLGSGWGTLLFKLARKYPERQIVGYELSWLPWAYTQLYKTIFRLHHVKIYRTNFLTTALPLSALLVCYLFPKGMQLLQQKLLDSSCSNTLLISSTFALSEIEPVEVIRLDDLYHTPIYLYRLK